MEKENPGVDKTQENEPVKIRNIGIVAKDLYNLIPEDSEKCRLMRSEMKKFILDPIPFKPPEIIFSNYFWDQLNIIVNKYITLEDSNNIEWCKKFIEIFLDPDYKISESMYNGESHVSCC